MLRTTTAVQQYGHYRRSHYATFLAFHGNQLEYNGSQGSNGAGSAGRFQRQGHEIHGRSVHNICTDTIIHKAAYCSYKSVSFTLVIKWSPAIAPWSCHYTPIFALLWQCDIMEYSCINSSESRSSVGSPLKIRRILFQITILKKGCGIYCFHDNKRRTRPSALPYPPLPAVQIRHW